MTGLARTALLRAVFLVVVSLFSTVAVGSGAAQATLPGVPRYNYDAPTDVVASVQAASTAVTTLPASARIDALRGTRGGARVPWSSTSPISLRRAAKAGTSLVRYDADAALGRLAGGNPATASELADFAESQGWARSQPAAGPLKFTDENGITRLTIKSGSARTPGSNFPHIEIRNAAGQRVDPYGNLVARKSPGNHTPIVGDLP